MTLRDCLEDLWHLSLLVFAVPPVLRFLAARRWACIAIAAAVLAAFAYHVAIVRACYAGGSLCRWGW